MFACENVILFALLVPDYHFFYFVNIFGKFEEKICLQSGWGWGGVETVGYSKHYYFCWSLWEEKT